MIVDGVHFVNSAYADGKRILAEGANAGERVCVFW